MNTATFSYHPAAGWSVPSFPALDSETTLVLLFGAPEFVGQPQAITELLAAYPRSHVIGCSTAGEIFGTTIADNSLSVAVSRFDATRLRSASAPIETAAQSFEVGQALATDLMAPDLRGVIVISDGMKVNGSELLRGVNAVLPPTVVVTGGLAGDGARFLSTWVLHDRVPAAGWISAVAFYGDHISVGHGSKGGWDIFGPERRVTRSTANVVHEIDGQPALDLYRTYLGELAAGLPANALLFPLSLRGSLTDDTRLVRTILGINELDKSMTFAGDIPQGSLVQLMRANFDRLIDGATEAARLTAQRSPAGPQGLSIAISCVGRRLVLGERAEEEVEAVADCLSTDGHLVGFYSYGEISPYATGRCELHNQTMTLTTLCEV